MTPTAAKELTASAAILEMEVVIDASRERVWQAIIERPDAWWISDLRCVSADSTISLDAQAGGHLIERDDAGGSLLWFTVIAVEPGKSINMVGSLAPPWGGPSQGFLNIALEEHDGQTTVKMTNSHHGHIAEGSLASMDSGWRMLLENGLKSLVETGQRV